MIRARIVAKLASAFAVAVSCAGGATANAPAGGATIDEEIAALLAAQPRWSMLATLDASYGYRDNLLLSSRDEERSPFVRGVAEVVGLRFPTGPLEYSFFVRGERTHFTEGVSVHDEARAWAQTELGYWLGDTVRVGLPVTGYYNDQVFDVSDTDVERTIAELKVKGAMVGPVIRWAFLPSWWVEAQAVGERKRYEDQINDGTVGEGAVRLGWIQGERLEIRAGAVRRWRNFDRRVLYTSAGRERPGTQLKISEQELQLRVDVAWDAEKRWKSSTGASLLHYRDSGSGYFNYREQRVDHEVEWKNEMWRVRLSGAASRIDFGVQTIGLGLNPPPRVKDEYLAEFRAERNLTKEWTVFAAYVWERSRSNDELASYRVNEGLLGVRWSWEK